jgi:hypothetical protein
MSRSSQSGRREVTSSSSVREDPSRSAEEANNDSDPPTLGADTGARNDTIGIASPPPSPAWVPREYEVPIRDASVSTPLTSSRSGTATATATAGKAQHQQHQQQHTAWEHFSTEANSHSMDPSRTRSIGTPPRPARTKVEAPQQQPQPQNEPKLALHDRVAASALAATLELLRMAGGATLSTTGKLVAPPLYITRTIILPNLWHATLDYIASITPTRAKSWFKILSSSVHHFFSVLRGTARGKVFQQRVVRVGGDILDSISSDNARQVLMDSMGCVVKTAEALHTPEVKALLDQLSVLGCRLVDTAASGRNKQLVHDVSAMIYSGFCLLADPSTTLALAEVTAYLCHALEMEDATMHQADNQDNADQQAARRHERDAYQRATYVDPVLLKDPDVTVEQVILSSLGVLRASSSSAAAADNDDTDGDGRSVSVPSNVMVNDAASDIWEQSSVRQHVDETRSQQGMDDDSVVEEDEFFERARNSVNISLLREQISLRAANIERTEAFPPNTGKQASAPIRDRVPTPVQFTRKEQENENEEEDVEDIGVVTTVLEDGATKASTRPRVRLDASDSDAEIPTEKAGQRDDNAWPNLVNPFPTENETSVHHFYRILDQVLERKRNQAVDSALDSYADGKVLVQDGRVKRQTRTAVGTGATKEPVLATIRQRLAKIRAEVGSGLSQDDRNKLNHIETIVREHSIFFHLASATIFLIVLAWIGFGCYGVYVFFYPSVQSSLDMAKSALGHTSSPTAQEVIIRIVRKVVHVNADGEIISQGPDSIVTEEGIEKITQCVAAAL